MSDTVMVALVSGAFSLAGTLITVIPAIISNRKKQQAETDKKFSEIKTEIQGIKSGNDNIRAEFDEYKRADENRWMQQTRVRILNCDDDLCDPRRAYPSRGTLEQAVKDVDDYRKYIDSHDDFHNGIGEAAMEHVLEVYAFCKQNNLFGKPKE